MGGATLQGRDAPWAVLTGAAFELDPTVPSNDVDLSGMDLRRANFSGVQLGGASFRDVDLPAACRL